MTKNNNWATYMGIDYKMASKGGLENYENTPDEHKGTNLDLILVSDASRLNGADSGQNAIAFSENYLDLEMFSSSSTKLSSGKYTFSTTEPHPTFSFSGGDFDLDFDGSGDDIVGGEVNIKESNGIYNIGFKLIDDNGNELSGQFNGSLTMFIIDDD